MIVKRDNDCWSLIAQIDHASHAAAISDAWKLGPYGGEEISESLAIRDVRARPRLDRVRSQARGGFRDRLSIQLHRDRRGDAHFVLRPSGSPDRRHRFDSRLPHQPACFRPLLAPLCVDRAQTGRLVRDRGTRPCACLLPSASSGCNSCPGCRRQMRNSRRSGGRTCCSRPLTVSRC